MTAGRGIVHSEMPKQEDGLLWGFQLWVNLPSARKMMPPRYQDLKPDTVPAVDLPGGGQARVLAGTAFEAEGPVRDVVTRPLMLDLDLPADAEVAAPTPAGHTAFAYVFAGAVAFAGGEPVARGNLVALGDGDAVRARGGAEGGRCLLLAAAPIGEPIARAGPFVMNTRAKLMQAIRDFQTGRFLDPA